MQKKAYQQKKQEQNIQTLVEGMQTRQIPSIMTDSGATSLVEKHPTHSSTQGKGQQKSSKHHSNQL